MTPTTLQKPCQFSVPCELVFGHISLPAQSKYYACKTIIASLLENELVLFDEDQFQALVTQLENQSSASSTTSNTHLDETQAKARSSLRILIGFGSTMPVERDAENKEAYIRLEPTLLSAAAFSGKKMQLTWVELEGCVVLKQAGQAFTSNVLQ